MTRDDIIRMAAKACDPNTVCARDGGWWTLKQDELERFARAAYAAGAAAEREACASICDRFQARNAGMQPAECAAAIRARGEK